MDLLILPSYCARPSISGLLALPRSTSKRLGPLRDSRHGWPVRHAPTSVLRVFRSHLTVCLAYPNRNQENGHVKPTPGVNVAALGKSALELSLGSDFVDDVISQLLSTAGQLGHTRDELAIKQAVFLKVIRQGRWAPHALLDSLAAAAASRIQEAAPGTLRMSQLANVALQFAAASCPPDDDLASSAGPLVSSMTHVEGAAGPAVLGQPGQLSRVAALAPSVCHLFEQISVATQRNIQRCSAQELADLAWAFTRVGVGLDGDASTVMASATSSTAGWGTAGPMFVGTFTPEALPIAALSWPSLCSAAATAVSTGSAHEAGILAFRFARAGMLDDAVLEACARRVTYDSDHTGILGTVLIHEFPRLLLRFHFAAQAQAHAQAHQQAQAPHGDVVGLVNGGENGPCLCAPACSWWPSLEAAFAQEVARRCAVADLSSLETLAVRLMDNRVGWQESMVVAARDAIARRDWSHGGDAGRVDPGAMGDQAPSTSRPDSTGMLAMGIKELSRAAQRLAWAGLLESDGGLRPTSLLSRVLAEVAAQVPAEASAKFLAESALHLSLAGAADAQLMASMAQRAGQVMHLHRVRTQVRAAAKFAAAGVRDTTFYAQVAAAVAIASRWDTTPRYEDQERALDDMAAGRFSPLSHLALWTLWLSAKSVPKPKPLTVGVARVAGNDRASSTVPQDPPGAEWGQERGSNGAGEANDQATGLATESFLSFDDPCRPLAIDVGCGFGSFVLGMACGHACAAPDVHPPGNLMAGRSPPDLAGQPCGGDMVSGEACNWLGIDVQPQAILRASAMAQRWRLDGRVRFVQGEATDFLRGVLEDYPGPVRLICIGFPTPYRLQQGDGDCDHGSDDIVGGGMDGEGGGEARKGVRGGKRVKGGGRQDIEDNVSKDMDGGVASQGTTGPTAGLTRGPPDHGLDEAVPPPPPSPLSGAAGFGQEVRGDRLFMVQPDLVELCSKALAPGGSVFIQSNSEEVAQAIQAQFDQTHMFVTGGTNKAGTAPLPHAATSTQDGGVTADAFLSLSSPVLGDVPHPAATITSQGGHAHFASPGAGVMSPPTGTGRIRRDLLWRQTGADVVPGWGYLDTNPFPAQTETEAACERSSRAIYRIQMHKAV